MSEQGGFAVEGEPQLIALDCFLCAHVASTCESYEHNINIDASWLLRMRN
jgi:hypothetical protein